MVLAVLDRVDVLVFTQHRPKQCLNKFQNITRDSAKPSYDFSTGLSCPCPRPCHHHPKDYGLLALTAVISGSYFCVMPFISYIQEDNI